ncbi:MAG: hypothetical protein U5L04_01955 [Trueperaceae bacterium]|nr:hypothetical protein [Trueperaceae bacterium]
MADDNTKKTEEKYETSSSARLGPATLGGVEGLGTLQILRATTEEMEIIEANGTWRLSGDDDKQNTSALKESDVVTYKGRLDDAKNPDQNDIEIKVRISHVRTYTYDELEGEPERVLYRFSPEEPLSL